METCEVGIQPVLLFQEDVETGEIQEWKLEILGRWIVDVRDQAVRVLRFCSAIESPDEALNPSAAVPPDDVARDLISDRIAEDCGMPLTLSHSLANAKFDILWPAIVVEEGNVLLPWQAHQDPDGVSESDVEQPTGRYRVDTYGIDPFRRH